MDHKRLVIASFSHESDLPLAYDVFEGWMWPDITNRLQKRLGASNYEELLMKLGAACRWITPYYTGPALPPGAKDRVASPFVRHSLNGAIWGLTPGIHEHGKQSAGHPLQKAISLEEIADYPSPSPEWFDYEGMVAEAKQKKGYFVVVGGFTPLFYLISDLRGMEQTLFDLIDRPDLVDALVRKILEFYKGYFSRIAKAGQGVIDAIAFGDDFSSQLNMLLSPGLWRRHFKPAWAELFALAKEYGFRTMFHSCGSLYPVIPDLIEIGLDVLYPVQPKAKNMDPLSLQDQFGNRLSFYGGLDVQELVPFGSPQEIQNEIQRLTQAFHHSGGYVLSTSHVIMENFPEENVLAIYMKQRPGNFAFNSTG